MRKYYEYDVLDVSVLRLDNKEELEIWLNKRGLLGWELVSIIEDTVIFKREINQLI